MLATKLARKARVGRRGARRRTRGRGEARRRPGRARRRVPSGATRSADDPLAGDAGDARAGAGRAPLRRGRTWRSVSAWTRNRRLRDRALALRAEILAAEGVPEPQVGNR